MTYTILCQTQLGVYPKYERRVTIEADSPEDAMTLAWRRLRTGEFKNHTRDMWRFQVVSSLAIRDMRCCLCPNAELPQNRICPAGPFKGRETDCDFVVVYADANGALVFVSRGPDSWITVRQKKPGGEVQRVNPGALSLRRTFDEAQADLNAYAKKKGWGIAG